MAIQPRVSTDLSVAIAVRDIILDLARLDGSPLTPQTHLSVAANAGDTSLTVDDPTQFQPGMLFSFYDDLDEDIPIDPTWNGQNPVLLHWAAMDYSGVGSSHRAGARVGTDLFIEVPNNIDDMVTTAAALVYIVNLDQKDVLVAGHQIEPVFSMHIEYRRALVQPQAATLNTNVWGMRQQRACRIDMELIAKAIRDNVTLTTAKGENAIGQGDPLNPQKERFAKQWQKIVIDAGTQHFAGMGDFSVRGFRQVFYGDAFGAA